MIGAVLAGMGCAGRRAGMVGWPVAITSSLMPFAAVSAKLARLTFTEDGRPPVIRRPVTVKLFVVSEKPFGPSTRKTLWSYVTPSLPTKGGSGLPVTGPIRPGSVRYFLPVFGYGLVAAVLTRMS